MLCERCALCETCIVTPSHFSHGKKVLKCLQAASTAFFLRIQVAPRHEWSCPRCAPTSPPHIPIGMRGTCGELHD